MFAVQVVAAGQEELIGAEVRRRLKASTQKTALRLAGVPL
jgi:hypothetical protein